jgi:penicillin amidase
MLNIVYADINGGIGYSAPGNVPIRKSGDGTQPVPGWSGAHNWERIIPFEELPHIIQPSSGYIINANNKPVEDDYPYLLSASFPVPYRANRIKELIVEKDTHTFNDMVQIQLDTQSIIAKELLPILINHVEGSEDNTTNEIITILKGWDYKMNRSKPEPLLFALWLHFINSELLVPFVGENSQFLDRIRPKLIKKILQEEQNWCRANSDIRIKPCHVLITKALRSSLSWLKKRTSQPLKELEWGNFHFVSLQHSLFGKIPFVNNLTNLAIATDGGDSTINRGSYASPASTTPFQHTHGSGFRAVYDLSNLENSTFIIPSGQSGHFQSKYYRNLLKKWRDGDMLTMKNNKEPKDNKAQSLILEPKK